MGCSLIMSGINLPRLCFLAVVYFSIILVAFNSQQFRSSSAAQDARSQKQTPDHSIETVVREEKAGLRAEMGSRPPRCDGRCSWCGRRCEAIQVPTSPQLTGNGGAKFAGIAYSRGDSSSNYKPMSWKCKCGDLIFNP